MENTYTPEQIALFERVLAHRYDVEKHLRHLDRIDAEHIVDGRRCIRVRPAPFDRSLEVENATNEEHRAYHARRQQEEIAAIQRRCDARCERLKQIADVKVDKLRWYESDGVVVPDSLESKIAPILAQAEESILAEQNYAEMRIAKIKAKRQALSWTCPDDGRAYEFVWENQRFLRMYEGEIWRDAAVMVGDEPHPIPVLGEWCGQWTGYYITSAPLIMEAAADGMAPRPWVARYE